MYPTLLHIWGPFSVHSFGAMIALGSVIILWLAARDKKLMMLLNYEQLLNLATVIVVSAIAGGRLLFVLEDWNYVTKLSDIFDLTDGGFSVLGAVLLTACTLFWHLRTYTLPNIMRILDRVCVYIPLLYSISRIGCFLAGCCYGHITDVPWAITYTNPEVFAPCYVPLHPTQLYSSAIALAIFLMLYVLGERVFKKPGQLVGYYFVLIAMERYYVDFLRADRIMINNTYSTSQALAIGIGIIGLLIFFIAQSTAWFKNERI